MLNNSASLKIVNLQQHYLLTNEPFLLFRYKVKSHMPGYSTGHRTIGFPSGTHPLAVFIAGFENGAGHAELIWSFLNISKDSAILYCSNPRPYEWDLSVTVLVGVHRNQSKIHEK